MKKFIAFLLVLFVGFAFFGCNTKEEIILPTNITIENAPKSDMIVGDKVTVSLKFTPSDVTAKDCDWKSSDSKVVLVSVTSSKVTIEAISAGTAVVTVSAKSAPDVKASITINVKEKEKVFPTALKIEALTSIGLNTPVQLNVTYTPVNTTEKDLVWSSSDDSIITVSEKGVVTGVKEGTATITCKAANDETITDSIEIKVSETAGITVESLVISGDTEMVINNVFKLKATATPAEAEFVAVWTSGDDSICTVDDKGNVTTVALGSTTITCTVSGSEVFATYDITVIAAPALESIAIANGHELEVGEFCNLGITETPKYAVYDVTWETSDSSILSVDETGKATGVAVGTATITATEKTTGFTATFDIKVNKAFSSSDLPEEIICNVDSEVVVGYTAIFTASVQPAGVNQGVIWKSLNESVGTIDETGKFTALSIGITRIIATSVVDSKVQSVYYKVTVIAKPVSTVPDLGGYKITIMNAKSALSDYDPFLADYKASDKTVKQNAWREIETEYNCKVSVEPYPDNAPWGPTRVTWLIQNASAGTTQTDIGVVSAAWLCDFVAANAAVDCTSFFGKFSAGQIEPAIKEAATFQGKLYCITTGLNPAKTYPIHGLFYNYGLVQKLGLDSPAKLFNDGLWTYDKFVEYCQTAQAVMGEGQFVMSGAPSLIWQGMVNAAGVKVADKTTMKLNLKHPYSYLAIETLQKVVEANAWDIDNIEYDEKVAAFQSGNAIFQPAEYWFVYNQTRFPRTLWGEDNTYYGYVPYPRPDDLTKEQTRVNYCGDSVLMLVAGKSLPSDVTYEEVYRAVADIHLRTTEKLVADPLFDPDQIKLDFTKTRIDDPESVIATTYFTSDKAFFDPLFDDSFQYSWNSDTTTAVNNCVQNGSDPAEEFEKVFSAVDQAFKAKHS